MTIFDEVRALCLKAKEAAPALALTSADKRNAALARMADTLCAQGDAILAANGRDLANAEQNGVPRVMLDRLRLTKERIQGIADAIRALILLADPLKG